jgi:hypothetical protein
MLRRLVRSNPTLKHSLRKGWQATPLTEDFRNESWTPRAKGQVLHLTSLWERPQNLLLVFEKEIWNKKSNSKHLWLANLQEVGRWL